MFPIFQSNDSLLAVILVMVAFSLWVQKFKPFRAIGPAMTVIILGILLVNTHIVASGAEIYGVVQTYCVPISISIYLLNVDLKEVMKMSKQPLMAIASAVFCVALTATIFGLVFAGGIHEGWKVAGMFVGTYTGGSGNLTAIATGLNASGETIAAANAADYVVGMPAMLLMFAAPALMKASKKWNKFWPYHFKEEELLDDAEHHELLGSEDWSIRDIAFLLAISTSIVALATKVSVIVFPESFSSAGRILAISTLSIIVAQHPAVKKLKGNLNLGLFFGMMFLAVIGFAVNLSGFFGSAAAITLFCLCVIAGSTLLHLFITRLLKIRYEYVLLGIVGAIADGTTAALVASGAKWNSLINIGLLMGIMGAVCGNYVGIGVAYLIKLLIGA